MVYYFGFLLIVHCFISRIFTKISIQSFRSFQHTVNFNYSNYLLPRHRKVPAPPSIHAENTNNSKLGGNNQKLILFSLGNQLYTQIFLLSIFTAVISYLIGLCIHPIQGASRIVSEDPTRIKFLKFFGFLHILPMYFQVLLFIQSI